VPQAKSESPQLRGPKKGNGKPWNYEVQNTRGQSGVRGKEKRKREGASVEKKGLRTGPDKKQSTPTKGGLRSLEDRPRTRRERLKGLCHGARGYGLFEATIWGDETHPPMQRLISWYRAERKCEIFGQRGQPGAQKKQGRHAEKKTQKKESRRISLSVRKHQSKNRWKDHTTKKKPANMTQKVGTKQG